MFCQEKHAWCKFAWAMAKFASTHNHPARRCSLAYCQCNYSIETAKSDGVSCCKHLRMNAMILPCKLMLPVMSNVWMPRHKQSLYMCGAACGKLQQWSAQVDGEQAVDCHSHWHVHAIQERFLVCLFINFVVDVCLSEVADETWR
jgi:hypothetical protein